MKFVLAALIFALPTFAHAARLNCDNGFTEDDRLMQVKIDSKSRRNAVELQLWETTVQLPASKIVKNGNSIAVLGQKTTVYAEGTEETHVIDALLVYSPKERTLTTTIHFDGHATRAAEVLKCR
jgi:hypothetical protein